MKILLIAAGIALITGFAAAAPNDGLDGSLSALHYGKNSASMTMTVINKTGKRITRANFVCSLVTEDFSPYASQTVQFEDLPVGGRQKQKITFRGSDTQYAYSASCDPVSVLKDGDL